MNLLPLGVWKACGTCQLLEIHGLPWGLTDLWPQLNKGSYFWYSNWRRDWKKANFPTLPTTTRVEFVDVYYKFIINRDHTVKGRLYWATCVQVMWYFLRRKREKIITEIWRWKIAKISRVYSESFVIFLVWPVLCGFSIDWYLRVVG